MRHQLRRVAILGSGSLVTLLVGLISAKVYALLLGPAGVGTIGILQALIAFVTPIAGAGVAAVLVQELAFRLARQEQAEADAASIAAQRLLLALGGAAAALLIIAREPVADLVLGADADATGIALAALAVVTTLATAFGVSVLNGYRMIANLARAAAAASLASGAVSILVIVVGGRAAIPLAILAGSTAAATVTLLLVRLSTPAPRVTAAANVPAAGRRLLGLGLPVAVGTVISGTVQLAVPIVVLHSLGAEAVGYYRAAGAISISYLGFLVVAMTQEYYPRLSAAADDPPGLARIAYEQQRMIVAIAIPLIMVVIATISLVIPLLYTASFAPAAGILETQLIGDLLKLPSWAFAFILIVQRRRRAYVFVELVAAVLLLGGLTVGIQVLGLPGVGLAYLVTYVVYYPLTYLVARRSAPLRLDAAVQGPIVFAFAASCLIAASTLLGLAPWRPLATAAAAAASIVIAARILVRELGPRLPARRAGTGDS